MGEPSLAQAADDRPRILLVSPLSPFPPDFGGAQRTALLYEALARDADVDLYLLSGAAIDKRTHDILKARFRLVGCFHEQSVQLRRVYLKALSIISSDLRSTVPDKWKVSVISNLVTRGPYQAVVLRYSRTACQLLNLRERIGDVPVFVDVDDFMSQLVDGPGGDRISGREIRPMRERMAASWIKRLERNALLKADGLWVNGILPSWFERDRYANVVDLDNIPFYEPQSCLPRVGRAGKPTIFLGVAQFGYLPNSEGFDWFLRHVWQNIRRFVPNATLRLVGGPPLEPFLGRWLETQGVEIVGRQENVAAEYGSADVAIAPIFRGGGTKIKVLEALAMGLPCVCTAHAAGGLDALPSLLVTDDPLQFARYCVDLAGDPPRREALASKGVDDVQNNFSRARFLASVRALVATRRVS